MVHRSEVRVGSPKIKKYLDQNLRKDRLRFVACGSVDDGKSSLLGRLVFDSDGLYEDQINSLKLDRKISSKKGKILDFSLLFDGLLAEREQGITIDVAYRYLSTKKRNFIIIDTPGHEQYTRNMATGASNAEAAIILVDARRGLLEQTRRHSFIISLLGIKHVAVAVNKMDLVDWSQKIFQCISDEYTSFASKIGLTQTLIVPTSAVTGENICQIGNNTPWYEGGTLLDYLENVKPDHKSFSSEFRMPVQWVNRANQNFRGLCGTISNGTLRVGQKITALPSDIVTTVERIISPRGDVDLANEGTAITLTLANEIDISRGDYLSGIKNKPEVTDQFKATIVWMDKKPLFSGRIYILRTSSGFAIAQITSLHHKVDLSTLISHSTKSLSLNEIGICNIALDRVIPLDNYKKDKETGSFILIDRSDCSTVACGMVEHSLRRAQNIIPFKVHLDKKARASANQQKACVIWFTGLSGAGKSTIADLVEYKLHSSGFKTMSLDGDNMRSGLNRDLGFTEADRVENIRRVAEVTKLMVDAGLIVLASFISPFRSERQFARDLLEEDEFYEVFIDTPIEICEKRDPKGLYKKAKSGLLPNFTGIDSPYEEPANPDLRLDTTEEEPETQANKIISFLKEKGILKWWL